MNTSIKKYANSAKRLFLTREQLYELIEKAEKGCIESRNRIAEKHILYAIKKAIKINNQDPDLAAECVAATVEAASRTKAGKAGFVRYLDCYIKLAVQKYFRKNSVVTKPHLAVGIGRVVKARDYLYQKLQKIPTNEEVSAFLGISDVLSFTRFEISDKDKTTDPADFELEFFDRFLVHLTDKQAKIIDLRFRHGLTMMEISARMGLSNQNLNYQYQQAIKKLKAVVNPDWRF